MRILVATTPGWGHVTPVLPLAAVLRDRGHELVWVTAADAARSLEQRGFAVRAHGLTIAERLPRAASLLAERVSGLPPNEVRAHAFTVNFAILGAAHTLDSIRAVAAEFRPEIIVREPAELGAAIVARTSGTTHAVVGFGGLIPEGARRMADVTLARQFDGAGLDSGDDRLHFGDLYLHPMPASMDVGDVPDVVRRVRPPRQDRSEIEPPELRDLGVERPAVYVTFGTEFGSRAPWAAVLEALGTLDVDALVTTGAAGIPAGSVVPGNVRVAVYVDQADVFGRVAAVVSHAGSGTLLGAAVAALPQVCIPLGADQFENAAAAVRRGVAVSVMPHEHDPGSIAAAVRRALSDPSVERASREVAAEIGDAGDLTAAVEWLEALPANPRMDG